MSSHTTSTALPDSRNVINGRTIAAQIQRELAQRVVDLNQRGVQPGLAFVRVGEDPASKVYVGRKEKVCAELGIFSEMHLLPESATEGELLALLGRLNANPRLHGILVQAPLPKQIRESAFSFFSNASNSLSPAVSDKTCVSVKMPSSAQVFSLRPT